ncbi:hypothetical protein NHX12_009452 [Muraenolepis orangiensis]|uniref:Uncharacterized protein n=1 Tax=Muraenolepis orangiensis TaxID=630683 RepID=A0A9Q0I8E1_9TELE|nr:hypothetical protein NHX12_009452 [Muraenolepis orangiensis]
MEGERQRLNHRITTLTGQLATATPELRPLEMLHSVDSQNHGTPKGPHQNQSLVSVPEEGESDWSETGDETPRFLLTGSGFLPWRAGGGQGGGWPGQGDGDGESGGEEEFAMHHPVGSLHLPRLHFTLHHEMFPYRVVPDGRGESGEAGSPRTSHGSSFLRHRSASLEEIAGACRHMEQQQQEAEELIRATGAMMDLHRPGEERHVTEEDSDNEIIHSWRSRADGDPAVGGKARAVEGSEVAGGGGGLEGLRSAQRMLNHLICEFRDRPGGKGWTGGLPEEVLGGERTEL